MKKLNSLIQYFKNHSDRSFYLSILRIFICFHLLKKLVLNWSSMEILYGTKSFVALNTDPLFQMVGLKLPFLQQNYGIILFIFSVLLILYLFGIGKHLTALGVFICLEIIQRMNGMILNGGDNLLKFIMLYMVFTDSYQYLSISKFRVRSKSVRKISNLVTNLSAWSIILHLCFIYLISAISKFHTDLWYNGVATYYTFSIERFSGTAWNADLVKNGWFVTLSTYGALFYELFFPTLVWFKKMRIPLLIIGIPLHLGIYVFMMIYDFQWVFIAVYGLLFTDKEWKSFLRKIAQKLKTIKKRLPLPSKHSHIFRVN